MLLHGSGGVAASFRPQIEGDFGKRFRVVAIELPVRQFDRYTQFDFAQMLVESAEKLNMQHGIFVGHSYGGHVLLEASIDLPAARGFAICGTPPLKMVPGLDEAFNSRPPIPLRYRDEVEIAATLTRPLAVFHGANDPFVSLPYIKKLTMPTLWRGAVQIIADSDHAPHREQPARFNTLLTQYIEDLL